MIVLREMASAKVNLYLHVTGKRADGYHELDSWVMFADTGDSLEAVKSGNTQVILQGPFAEAIDKDSNSVLQAIKALQPLAGAQDAFAFTLNKRLPVASGIGGGSADAAAALRLLARLANLKLTEDDLQKVGLPLGADVPACIRSQSLYMNGIGEKITPAPQVQLEAVLVNPRKPVATRDVFQALGEKYSSAMRHPPEFAGTGAVVAFLKQARNDLEPPAIAIAPVIADVLAALDVQKGCLLARMSGSGATCFGIYESREYAQEAASLLGKAYPEWWVQYTRLR